jgi:two-component system chemotaxis response regulator CheB
MAENKLNDPCKLLIIGGSAGSIEVLLKTLPALRPGLGFAIVIVLHRKSATDSSLVELFSTRASVPIKEVEDKDIMMPGIIYVAPADYHLLFEKDNTFSLDFSEKVNYSRPSIDVTFESASDIYGPYLTCLLLSGANSDGVEGMRVAKANGGYLAVQDPNTADSFFMPLQALMENKIDRTLKKEEIADFINTL